MSSLCRLNDGYMKQTPLYFNWPVIDSFYSCIQLFIWSFICYPHHNSLYMWSTNCMSTESCDHCLLATSVADGAQASLINIIHVLVLLVMYMHTVLYFTPLNLLIDMCSSVGALWYLYGSLCAFGVYESHMIPLCITWGVDLLGISSRVPPRWAVNLSNKTDAHCLSPLILSSPLLTFPLPTQGIRDLHFPYLFALAFARTRAPAHGCLYCACVSELRPLHKITHYHSVSVSLFIHNRPLIFLWSC